MVEMPSRREFIGVLLSSGALGAAAPSSDARDGASGSAPDAKPASPRSGVDKGRVEAEVRRRARRHLAQRRLVVDYYRIGRRLAYPLPLTSTEVRVRLFLGLSEAQTLQLQAIMGIPCEVPVPRNVTFIKFLEPDRTRRLRGKNIYNAHPILP